MTLDRETLEYAAEQALARPSNASFWDDRLFTTHGATFSWAERGDDITEESNYLSALELIQSAAGEDSDEHVIDATISHWLVGSARQLFVQVYETRPECDTIGCEEQAEVTTKTIGYVGTHHCGEHADALKGSSIAEVLRLTFEPYADAFTPAFREATELALYLQGGGSIIDESDHSERESERFEKNLREAIDRAQREFPDDSDEDAKAILERAEDDLGELYGQEPNAEVSWDGVAEIYAEHRDEFFDARARQILFGVHPDQLAIPVAA